MSVDDPCSTNPECCGRGYVYVNQRPYVPGQGARMETFEPLKIIFRNGGQCGIPVRDGIAKQFRDLERRDSRPFQDVSVADQATLRIEWPGYPPWHTYFRTRDSTPENKSVTLSWLVEHICKGIEKFLRDMEGEPCTEHYWRVGRNTFLNVDTLALVSLERASYGSWVARIRLI